MLRLSSLLSPVFGYQPSCPTSLMRLLLWRTSPRSNQLSSVFGTIGTLTPARVHPADRSPRLLRATFPSFRPQTRCTPQHRFIRHDSVLRCFQASPRGCGLAAIRRRNRFVILRTDSSLPVTSHPASRRRSYLPLRSCGQLRQGLAPCKWHALTGVRRVTVSASRVAVVFRSPATARVMAASPAPAPQPSAPRSTPRTPCAPLPRALPDRFRRPFASGHTSARPPP